MSRAATGTITTAHASRYLQQLCKHWSHKLVVEFTAEHGRVEFTGDTVAIMQADAAGLTVRIEAPDAETVERMKGVVMNHLDRFAFREAPLAAAWRDKA
jgi:hypothetical protein